MSVSLTFLGGVKTTSGSRYLLTAGSEKILIDCGLFEGFKELRSKNWRSFPVSPSELNAVLLTHSNLDKAGYLPRLVKEGFQGKIYCSEATKDLCSFVLRYNARSMEEDTLIAKQLKYSKHENPLPLYTEKDAEESLKYFQEKNWEESFQIGKEFEVCLHYAGHILGAALIIIKVRGMTILFSGALGRLYDPLLLAPSFISKVDYLILESTYGNQLHPNIEPENELKDILNERAKKKSVILFSASTTSRPQLLLSLLNDLKNNKQVSRIPIYVDSPVPGSNYKIFEKFENEYRLPIAHIQAGFKNATYVSSLEESKKLSETSGPMIIISGNEMATKGRILEHLKTFGSDSNNLILFSGFPTPGTRGAQLLAGNKSIKIHGAHWPIRAEIKLLQSLSFHADYSEILEWLQGCRMKPKMIFITHGEAKASSHLRQKIEKELGWKCLEPTLEQTVDLNHSESNQFSFSQIHSNNNLIDSDKGNPPEGVM